MDILIDLNRRLHGLRDHEFMSVPCAQIKAWRDEIVRLRELDRAAEKDGIALDGHFLKHNGATVRVASNPAKMLAAWIKYYPREVTRERMVNIVYGDYSQTDPKTLDVVITGLRKKLKPIGLNVETIWGVGHRLVKL